MGNLMTVMVRDGSSSAADNMPNIVVDVSKKNFAQYKKEIESKPFWDNVYIAGLISSVFICGAATIRESPLCLVNLCLYGGCTVSVSTILSNCYLARDPYNMAAGLAGSLFHGYLKILAGGDLEEVLNFNMGNGKMLKDILASNKLFLLFPLNGKVHDMIDQFENITTVGKLLIARKDRGCERNRPYWFSIYEVKHRDRYYYFAAGYAMGLSNIEDMLSSLSLSDPQKIAKIRKKQSFMYIDYLLDLIRGTKDMDLKKNDIFHFLLYENDNPNVINEIMVEGLINAAKTNGKRVPITHEKRVNLASLLQKHPKAELVLTDDLVDDVVQKGSTAGKYVVQLKGDFGDDSSSVHGVERRCIAAKKALERFDSRPKVMQTNKEKFGEGEDLVDLT